jgi:hypothetical protein
MLRAYHFPYEDLRSDEDVIAGTRSPGASEKFELTRLSKANAGEAEEIAAGDRLSVRPLTPFRIRIGTTEPFWGQRPTALFFHSSASWRGRITFSTRHTRANFMRSSILDRFRLRYSLRASSTVSSPSLFRYLKQSASVSSGL